MTYVSFIWFWRTLTFNSKSSCSDLKEKYLTVTMTKSKMAPRLKYGEQSNFGPPPLIFSSLSLLPLPMAMGALDDVPMMKSYKNILIFMAKGLRSNMASAAVFHDTSKSCYAKAASFPGTSRYISRLQGKACQLGLFVKVSNSSVLKYSLSQAGFIILFLFNSTSFLQKDFNFISGI